MCDAPCVAQQASTATSPKPEQSVVRPQGVLVRPKDGAQHPDLDKAWTQYDAAVTSAYTRVRTAIEKQFDAAAADGDLDSCEKWQAELKRFDDNGRLPSDPGTQNAVGDAVNGLDLPPLNGTTSRERIWGWSKPREATNATRKEGTG